MIGDIEGLRGLLRKREDEMGALKANWASEVYGAKKALNLRFFFFFSCVRWMPSWRLHWPDFVTS